MQRAAALQLRLPQWYVRLGVSVVCARMSVVVVTGRLARCSHLPRCLCVSLAALQGHCTSVSRLQAMCLAAAGERWAQIAAPSAATFGAEIQLQVRILNTT